MSQSINDPLHRLTHAYTSRLRQLALEAGIGLPVTHIRVLKGVCGNPQSTAHSIATRIQRDKAQITRVLQELTKNKLITKVNNPKDGRSQLIQPTPEGRRIVQKLRTLEVIVMQQVTQSLELEEVNQFIHLAGKIADSLEMTRPHRNDN